MVCKDTTGRFQCPFELAIKLTFMFTAGLLEHFENMNWHIPGAVALAHPVALARFPGRQVELWLCFYAKVTVEQIGPKLQQSSDCVSHCYTCGSAVDRGKKIKGAYLLLFMSVSLSELI